ncbi:Pentatricopeptide repeat [Macleaya cordata]|uniref:Pentatricopeptide repeat n=1 Tax=Macleaya cordata TaxID=56857 RepID=A0A200R6B2_MACCD|nr:Pentatricopeptide repeat [Macleaya cordata]
MSSILFQLYNSAISRPFSAIHQLLPKSSPVSSNARKLTNKVEEERKALRILDLITPKTTITHVCKNHLRLIQACMQDLVEKTNPNQYPPQRANHNSISQNFRDIPKDVFDEIPNRDVSGSFLFFQMHKEGIKADKNALSGVLSNCGSLRAFDPGIQLHCLAIKTGFELYVYVGSSLINLYAKCGHLENAYKVFDEMPVRNVVSWTSIIAAFAQNWQVEKCLELYHQMRNLTLKPNEFTFTSLLSACTGMGSLGQGRTAHCQIIQMGFDSYTDISNALISMYSKCGNIKEAIFIFEKMQRRDLISWNSMIAGFAQHGHAEKAIDLLKKMEEQKVTPDSITFLGILSSCRHSGLVEFGRLCFNSMLQNGVEPDLDHYSCIVDLLGRAGLLEEAREFIEKMPISPNAVIWGSLLSSCRLHGNVWVGIHAAEKRILFEPDCAATHVQLAKLYASAGRWDQTARVRKLMKDKRLKTNPGYSWIEIKNEIYRFGVDDGSNERAYEIFDVVDSLVENMRRLGYVPKLHEEGINL